MPFFLKYPITLLPLLIFQNFQNTPPLLHSHSLFTFPPTPSISKSPPSLPVLHLFHLELSLSLPHHRGSSIFFVAPPPQVSLLHPFYFLRVYSFFFLIMFGTLVPSSFGTLVPSLDLKQDFKNLQYQNIELSRYRIGCLIHAMYSFSLETFTASVLGKMKFVSLIRAFHVIFLIRFI